MEPITYFVTLNWNTTGLLQDMVGSVEVTTPVPHTWIIVDNGSDDKNQVSLYDWAHRFFSGDLVIIGTDHIDANNEPRLRSSAQNMDAVIVRSDENLGCIKGHNLAFDVARMLSNGEPHEIVMIDSDVVVTEAPAPAYHSCWLSLVRKWADRHPEIGIVGMEHGLDVPCAPAVWLDTNGNWYLHQEQMQNAEPVEGESVGLGFALVRWPVLQAGLRFDPVFEMYYKQDDDFCFQVRADLGLEVWVHPVKNVHYGSGSLQANSYQVGESSGWDEFDVVKQRNQTYFTKKWRWALKERRRNMEEQARHLAEMKQVMADRRS